MLERVLGDLRDARHADAARRQARRHRLDDGRRTRRPTSATTAPLRADALTVSPFLGYELAAARARPRRGDRSRGVRAGPHLQPRGVRGAARGPRRTARWRRRSSAGAAARQRGARRPGASWAASGWSSAPRSATRSHDLGHRPRRRPTRRSWPRASARRAGRVEALAATFGAARCRRCWPAPAVRCSGPARTWPPSEPRPRERLTGSRTLCAPDRTQMFVGLPGRPSGRQTDETSEFSTPSRSTPRR